MFGFLRFATIVYFLKKNQKMVGKIVVLVAIFWFIGWLWGEYAMFHASLMKEDRHMFYAWIFVAQLIVKVVIILFLVFIIYAPFRTKSKQNTQGKFKKTDKSDLAEPIKKTDNHDPFLNIRIKDKLSSKADNLINE